MTARPLTDEERREAIAYLESDGRPVSDLADRLAATLRHLPTDAAPHRRLEIARMTALTDPANVRAMIDRFEAARNQARHFGLDADDKADDFDRADALRRRVREAGDYPIACLATALDELPELSREAQATLAALLTELDAARLLAPSREWWAEVASLVGRSCVTLPDALTAVREAMERKDAEIARLKAEITKPDSVGAILDCEPVGTIAEWTDDEIGAWHQMRGDEDGNVEIRTWRSLGWSRWTITASAIYLPARIVKTADADASPLTRGPIEVKP